eukprot:TRINITY_DN5257_c0_g1_i1.p1 TRINITY_DN5257_c0_g1~~TRINITY_DN5257_c0_g1_i1.p1  ORF type:complete len:933 (+),score=241.59 TRINITY_DN5257_c0_g1_i1:45-2843(+)
MMLRRISRPLHLLSQSLALQNASPYRASAVTNSGSALVNVFRSYSRSSWTPLHNSQTSSAARYFSTSGEGNGEGNGQGDGSNGNEEESKKIGSLEIIDVSELSDDLETASTTKAVGDPAFPTTVPIFPLYRRPIFPAILSPIVVPDSLAQTLSKRDDNPFVGLFLVKDPRKSEATKSITSLDQIHHVGVLGRVLKVTPSRTPGLTEIVVHSLRRIKADGVETSSPHMTVNISMIKDQPYHANDQSIRAYVAEIASTIREILSLNPFFKEQIQHFADQVNLSNPSEIADLAVYITNTDALKLQELLEMTSVEERLQAALSILLGELEVNRLQEKIHKELEEKVASNQRKYYLNEQLKMIKKELGLEQDEKESLMKKFNERLEKMNVPPTALKTIKDEMTKLSLMEPSSSEFNILRNYVDWLTLLPWGVYSKDSYDIKEAAKVLNTEHYGLKDIKERILEFIAIGNLRRSVDGKILCFVGPPGVGKTSIGKSIAQALSRKFYRFSVGGMSDVAEIKGHRRTYIGALPGKMIQSLKMTQTANPVVMIDEIDKLGRGIHGDPASALLEVLDPEQNSAFVDHYLDTPFDLSKVLFVCTANSLETIPGPLLDRMEVIRLSGYVLAEKEQIAKRYLVPASLKESGMKEEFCKIEDIAIRELIEKYCREAGVRNLQKQIEKIHRKAALKIARKKVESIAVTDENLHEFVGKPVFNSDRYYDQPPTGVAMGLAWTQLGGATLYIESVASSSGKKSGGLITTGKMGEVMKESTDLALTFSKNYLKKVQPESEFFDSSSIHMHIPEGATPKDGPSAGITMVTSLLSLALNKKVRNDLAMTGEITLTGKVLPIGGVREKTVAASRSGIKLIILPESNRKDWEELPAHVRKGIKVQFADYYDDVFEIAFKNSADQAGTESPADESSNNSINSSSFGNDDLEDDEE